MTIRTNRRGRRGPVGSPLALRHPIRRYLLNVPVRRSTLRQLLRQSKPVPVRVLVVGSHPGDLPRVDEEIEVVQGLYADWFDKMGWPRSDLTVLEPGSATAAKLEDLIRNGRYQVLHFAGHGLTGDTEPALAVTSASAKDRSVPLPASVLAEWVSGSDLRLVYLSSCHGAGETVRDKAAVYRFESLSEALVRAGVPEVVGFRWPISDGQSRLLAERFHDRYLRTFDASEALFEARSATQTWAQVWAAAVVIAQRDSLEPGE